MTSEKQLEADRRNARLSTGPRTEEGRHHSSVNALRHGLTGQVTAMTEDDRAAHDAFTAAMLKELSPEGAVETQLARRIATEHPQIHAAFTAAKTFEAEAKHLQLLSLYEQRLNRAVHKNLAALRELQAKHKAERQSGIEEAKKLRQLSRINNLPWDSAKNGFVFSNEEIEAARDRDRRLARAEHLEFRHHKHQKLHTKAA